MQVTPVRRPSFAGSVVNSNAGAVGDVGETVIAFTKVRASEAPDSACVAELPSGTQFEVVEVGTAPNRIRVTATGHYAGWINKADQQGKPLVKWVRKRRTSAQKKDMQRKTSDEKDSTPTQDGLSPGAVCETVIEMTLREGEDFKSSALGQIPQGTQFEIVGVAPPNRVRVVVPDTVLEGGAVGWISSQTDAGKRLIKLIKAGPKRRQSSFNLTKNMSIPLGGAPKATVEAAPPGMRRSLLPVPASAAAEKPPAEEEAPRMGTPEAPDAAEAQEDPDAKARLRGERARAKASKPTSAPPARAPWWACCCSS